ncbi:MAG TPA: N-acetylmuramoyl-L-alanine amidase [Streptosporangiaceae bacterium]|nr:N-acetylmuramoyl-L-alanine amidase [Streptosporangiaceae bacterium]
MRAAAGCAAIIAVAAGGLAIGFGGAGPALPAALHAGGQSNSGGASGARMAQMRAAAREFGVPVAVLMAVSYVETRWERTSGGPSVDGGYGVMNLIAPSVRASEDRGVPGAPSAGKTTQAGGSATLDKAVRLLRMPASMLKTSQRQNIRGAAAVLANFARGLDRGRLPSSLGGWYGAVAKYSGAATRQAASIFADDVFAAMRSGASMRTGDGQVMTLAPARGVRPDRSQLVRLGLASPAAATTSPVDCPSTISCSYIPAAYSENGTDPSNYGNYDLAGRPDSMRTPSGGTASMKIDYIIIHDVEGSYSSAIATFQNPTSFVSANYVINSSSGAVAEMVRPGNVSWGAGDWYINMHAINIENEGFAAQGATWYTQAEYQSCALLVQYLAAKYGIPLDREHILGHEDLPGPTNAYTAAQHWDPGPFWNWNHFMALVHGVSDTTEQAGGGSLARGTHQLVTIDPTFSANKQSVTDCTGGKCTTLPTQPANFVHLRTGPGTSYPLFPDSLLHPGATAGTRQDSDWGDKAATGETFVFAGQSGNWTAIYYAGHKAWFYDPSGTNQAARYSGGAVITPKAGLASAAVYGAAYPEASAYPAAIPPTKVVKLSYTIPAGQFYPVVTAGVTTDFYYAKTFNSSLVDDHTIVIGATPYYQISYNHRKFYVQASQVTVQTLP